MADGLALIPTHLLLAEIHRRISLLAACYTYRTPPDRPGLAAALQRLASALQEGMDLYRRWGRGEEILEARPDNGQRAAKRRQARFACDDRSLVPVETLRERGVKIPWQSQR